MSDDVRYILESALTAPSGDNTQPWRWKVRGNVLELWSHLSVDIMSTLFGASPEHSESALISFGMAIENSTISAAARGYRAEVSYLPDPAHPTFVARITLYKDGRVAPDLLVEAISKRVTNRRPYKRTRLHPNDRTTLLNAGNNESLGAIKLVDDPKQINELAKEATFYEELVVSNQTLFAHFYSLISPTKSEDSRRRIGFYLPTLALPPLTWIFFWLLNLKGVMQANTAFKINKLVALEQRIVARHASAFGIVLTRGNTPTDWIQAGHLTERLWLAASKNGLSIQPMNGLLYFARNADTEEAQQVLSPEQREKLKEGSARIANVFGVENKTIAFMFRVGYAKPPRFRTSRRPFEEMVDIVSV